MRAVALAVLAAIALVVPAWASGDDANFYTNVSGNHVHRPEHSDKPPAGATAHCRDGTWSFSQHHSGTCSHHGGVAAWR
jgi:hypothetical protein